MPCRDGTYPLPFLSILSNLDITHDFYYSESLFDHPATEYDHQLAFVTLGMVMAAFTAAVSIPQYWVNGSVGREANLAAAYELLGFGDARFYNYDIDTGKAGDFVGYSLARKRYIHNGKTRTLVALMLRGGGYGGEWASNVHTGSTSAHYGFTTPVAAVFASLKAYLTQIGQEGDPGELKLWIGGYSRGAIIANLLAAKALNTLPQLEKANCFVYTFATPAALTAADQPDMQLDFDNNHKDDGSLRVTWGESNIFNILSSGDLVTRVLPSDWGYHRNGNDRFLPATRNRTELADLDALGASYGRCRWRSAALPPPRTPLPSSARSRTSAAARRSSTRSSNPPSWTCCNAPSSAPKTRRSTARSCPTRRSSSGCRAFPTCTSSISGPSPAASGPLPE